MTIALQQGYLLFLAKTRSAFEMNDYEEVV
jgi:hypothetical protein